MFRLTFLFFLSLSSTFLCYSAKLHGLVTSPSGEPLPFLTVYIDGTTNGTTTNADGKYFLELKNGNYEVVFRYVGFETLKKAISISNEDVELNVEMKEQSVQLGTVIVSAESNPALSIIKKAQAKRKFYLEQVKQFSCDTYIKGMNYAENIPTTFMGRSIDIAGLDTNRSGIVYLSESVSKYHFKAPDEKKEEIISSKVSGKSQGFTWNSATDFDVNFYKNNLDFGFNERAFISPISNTSTVHYKYKYHGSFMEDGINIHKIEVIPRASGAPLFGGFIYIQDASWRIHEIDFLLTKDAGIDFIDTLTVNQVYIPVEDSIWMLGTQRFEVTFSIPLVSMKGTGYYLGVFSNYDLANDFEKKFFKGPEIKVEESSNEKSDEYWEDVRIIPLTSVEVDDYDYKDSIEVVRESKEYLDSLDKKRNRYKFSNLLFGYQLKRSYKDVTWKFPSLFRAFQYNTVEGALFNLAFGYSKYNRDNFSRLNANIDLRIGTSAKVFYKASSRYRFNATNRMYIQLSGGSFPYHFNTSEPISPLLNTLYTLILEDNYQKTYQKSFGVIAWGREVVNGVNLRLSAEFSNRAPLQNDSDLIRIYNDRKDKDFTPNYPILRDSSNVGFTNHNGFILELQTRIRFDQTYYEYPKRKINLRSKWPELSIKYRKGINGFLNSSTNFDLLRIAVDDEMKLGMIGSMEWKVEVGKFLRKRNLSFVDYKHFNTSQVHFVSPGFDRFKALNYYSFSTADQYLEVHLEHHFNRFLMNKIPLIRKLGWQTVAGFHFLYTSTSPEYFEITAGIEHIFKVGRIDLVYAFEQDKNPKPHVRLSFGF